MEKTYKLFKRFLPIIFILSCIGLIFAMFTILYYYNPDLPGIYFGNVIPIFTILFLCAAFGVAFAFAFSVKSLHIKRIRKSSNLSKFAALLAAGLVTALFLYNFIQFVQFEVTLSVFKNVRLIFAIPFVAYLVIGILPKKIKKKKIVIPKWVTPITAICTIAWCILGLLAIYFWEGDGALPMTNVFRLMHMFYQVVVTVFFLSEIGFEVFSKGHKFYVLSASCLFITTFVLSGGMMFGKFLRLIPKVTISDFEIFAAFALGIYALSKLVAIQQTIYYVMKKDRDGSSHHHHHHHHHTSKKASAGVDKSSIPADIDI